MTRRRGLVAVALSAVASLVAVAPADAATSLYPDLKTLSPSELHSELGSVNGEKHWLLRFSNTVWNAGQGPLEIHGTPGGGSTVYQRIYDDAGGYTDAKVATDLTFHESHDHFHLGNFARYQLWTKEEYDAWLASGRSVGQAKHFGTKASFCLLDSQLVQSLPGTPSSRAYTECGSTMQGISVGYGDYYDWSLPEQWIDVGTSPLADGTYVLRSVVDPDDKLYESENRRDPTRESAQANEAITEFTVTQPVISEVSASASASGEATVSWTTDEPSSSRVDYGPDPAKLDRSVSDATQVTAHSMKLTGLTPGATYHFRVTSVDAAGTGVAVSPAPAQAPASFTVPGDPGCPCSLWSDSAVPTTAAASDGNAVELGVKFTPETDGTITALRFYKGSTNTGTHVGNLWSADGAQLASVTFSNETASGWQQATLSTPVAVKAGRTYVASYHAPNGNYAVDQNYFATARVNGALRAPSSDESAGNGVYSYGASAFPTQTYNASNYWVDVVFSTASSSSDTTAPTVTSMSPSAGATGVATSVTPTATFSETMDASTMTASTVWLTGPSGTVPASVSYDLGAQRVTLTPASALAASTTYTMTVKGGTDGVADLAGNRLAADHTWSFTTAAESPPADTVAPVISGVSASASASGEATVSWTTDEPSSSKVEYGTDPASLDRSVSDATQVTGHSMKLTGLAPRATYHFRVTSVDAAANSATSPAPPEAPASFTVPAATTVAFPSDVVVETGGLRSGSFQDLAAEDSAYLRVGAGRQTEGRVTSWYGRMSGVPTSPASLQVTYAGSNSKSCEQVLAIYRWTTGSWVQLDARSVGDTDMRIAGLSPPGTAADYVGADGEVRVRVRCTTGSNFESRGNLMEVRWTTA